MMAMITACGGGEGTYADGTYTGQSEVYEGIDEGSGASGEGYGIATITISNNTIVDCKFETYTPDGTLKDEEYGKVNGEIANQDFYNKAQRAVQASANYAEQLKAKAILEDVDAISGATISYNEFMDAVRIALEQAKK